MRKDKTDEQKISHILKESSGQKSDLTNNNKKSITLNG
jgi:hypothetical protein